MATATKTPSRTARGADRRRSVLDLAREELADELEALGEPRYRSDQLWQAVYADGAESFDAVSTLPRQLRSKLAERFSLLPLEPVLKQRSRDRSVDKTLFRLADGELIETVLMRYGPSRGSRARRAVCVSTQAGCALGCTFCATGQQGFSRNLSVGEIVGQVLQMSRVAGASAAGGPVTNVVFMGMGEPLANYQNTMDSIATLNDERGLNIGARHMTVSTVGLAPQIVKLAEEPYQVNLAVSLHAPNDVVRSETMPVNRRYPLNVLMRACRDYVRMTNRRVSFEYVLLAGQNDHPDYAEELGRLLRGMLCHVNLIPVNRTEASYRRPNNGRIGKFRDLLRRAGIPVTVRFEKGTDIDAGCGQLRARALAEAGMED